MNAKRHQPWATWPNAVTLFAYVMLLWLIYVGMDWGRTAALRDFDTPETRESWRQWKDDAGSIRGRRAPQATEPPAVLLMRDLFWTCVISAWIVATTLYLFVALVVRGMIGSQPVIVLEDTEAIRASARSANRPPDPR